MPPLPWSSWAKALTALLGKQMFLMFSLNPSWCNMRPLPLVPLLVAWKKRLAPTHLQSSFRLKDQIGPNHYNTSPLPHLPTLPSPSYLYHSLAHAACSPKQPSPAEPDVALLISCFTGPSGFQAQLQLLSEPFTELLSVHSYFFKAGGQLSCCHCCCSHFFSGFPQHGCILLAFARLSSFPLLFLTFSVILEASF